MSVVGTDIYGFLVRNDLVGLNVRSVPRIAFVYVPVDLLSDVETSVVSPVVFADLADRCSQPSPDSGRSETLRLFRWRFIAQTPSRDQ